MTLEKLKEELDKRNIPYEEEKTKKEYNEKINIGDLGDMVVFNLAEELEKERKKNKELEEENKKINNLIYKDYNDNEAYKSRIDKALRFIQSECILSDKWEDLGFCNFVPTGRIKYKQLSKAKVEDLLNILKGSDNNE